MGVTGDYFFSVSALGRPPKAQIDLHYRKIVCRDPYSSLKQLHLVAIFFSTSWQIFKGIKAFYGI